MTAHLRRSLALIALSMLVIDAAESSPRPPPEAACAAYDVHFVTLVEDHGRARELRAETIAAAMMALINARTACRHADYPRAFQIFESISLERPDMLLVDAVAVR